MSTPLRFTVSDLELLPRVDGNRYEIIDGDLHVLTQPHWRHQMVCVQIAVALANADPQKMKGAVLFAPGIIFASDQAVAPDVVWVRRERFDHVVDADGKLRAAPDLVVEVLSPGRENQGRDRELKLKLYSRLGVHEYWIVDWQEPSIQVYRREQAALQLTTTLTAEDVQTSPLLPGFAARVGDLCAATL